MLTITKTEAEYVVEKVKDKFVDLVYRRMKINRVGGEVTKQLQRNIKDCALYLEATSKYKQDRFEIGEFNSYISQLELETIMSRIHEM